MKPDIALAELIPGFMSPIELEWLACQAKSCQLIIEVGSWKGRSTKALAMHASGVVFAVDHWNGSPNDETLNDVALKGADGLFGEFLTNLAPELNSKRIIPIRAESGNAVPILRQILGDQKVDMVFIDADHSYDSVTRDILNYRPFVRKGGVLSGHDYSSVWPGVRRAVDRLVRFKSVIDAGSIWHSVL
jgi:hypothetical protein